MYKSSESEEGYEELTKHSTYISNMALVCLKALLQMCLSPSDNLSQNPKCEAFTHVWDEEHE
jgi:hypothetical protein